MEWISIILIVVGLALFEVVSGVDNAVLNAETLTNMHRRSRRIFLTWGMFFAVFVVRGMLPWLVVWLTVPGISFLSAFTATFSNDPTVALAMKSSAPILLIGSGIFLFLLFSHWFFLEPKRVGFMLERYFYHRGLWFYGIAAGVIGFLVLLTILSAPELTLGAMAGAMCFFIIQGFRREIRLGGKTVAASQVSDIRKLFYLEAVDTSFSIDGVLGAFAFTLSVPLILLGNGLGAIFVRQITIANIYHIRKYVFLKNGAMYSILVLSGVMLMHAFALPVPEWLSPVLTMAIVGYFFWKSRLVLHRGNKPLELS